MGERDVERFWGVRSSDVNNDCYETLLNELYCYLGPNGCFFWIVNVYRVAKAARLDWY